MLTTVSGGGKLYGTDMALMNQYLCDLTIVPEPKIAEPKLDAKPQGAHYHAPARNPYCSSR